MFIVCPRKSGSKKSSNSVQSGSNTELAEALIYQKAKRKIALTKTCTSLCICFVVCWTPFTVVHSVRSFRLNDSETVSKLFSYTIWLGWLNSALNPLIYYSNIKLKNHVSKRINNNLCCVTLSTVMMSQYSGVNTTLCTYSHSDLSRLAQE